MKEGSEVRKEAIWGEVREEDDIRNCCYNNKCLKRIYLKRREVREKDFHKMMWSERRRWGEVREEDDNFVFILESLHFI